MLITWMTCAGDRREHAVTDEEVLAGHQRGVYRAACGHLVAAAPLICPPGRRCTDCLRTQGSSRRV
jgi:hypothetical protein